MSDLLSHDLLFRIYNTISAPDTWPDVLAAIAADLDATHAFIAARGSVDEQPFAFVEVGFEPGHFERYQQHFFSVDVWTKALAQHEPNCFHASHEVYDDKAFTRSEIYTDFARPADIRHSLGCLLLSGDGERQVMMTELAFMRGNARVNFTPIEKRRADAYLTHVEQALKFGRQLQGLHTQEKTFERLFSEQATAAFVCDYQLRVYEFNTQAETLMRSVRLVQVDGLQRLRFYEAKNQAQAEALVGEYSNATYDGHESFAALAATKAYRVTMSPWLHATVTPWGPQHHNALLVKIEPLRTTTQISPRLILSWTDMTVAEAGVAALLCEGLTLPDIAARRGVSLGTVRQQVKAAIQKAGCRSQAQLIARLLAMSL
ncbi:transcriptional regulator, LuxR family [Teredinibacter turnerae T7901]|uniref:Transcriptional regulator, LuxR family n=1 Tax=Teredinibacter turnerae (strain ATCC 39867 / T7901) TaxID=377629 RepID=C5BMP5_TERTT|nr:helix-turn-helix transcriptional regulator [Teredinibacter turnerae]ACR14653.1 transcriptional regulator, LuxR family [Teredinibacter turnerae T7901]